MKKLNSMASNCRAILATAGVTSVSWSLPGWQWVG
ncbi:hypothetical protein BH11PSE3_BH11PSE3_14540 [soil metagenome]